MSKYLLNNKLYDTEKSELILTYVKNIEVKGMFYNAYPSYIHELYKTKKGNFFTHVGKSNESNNSYPAKDYIEVVSEDDVKELLNTLNQVDKYEKIFGKIEEA